MTPQEYVKWFYEKFKDCYEGSGFGIDKDQLEIIKLIERNDIKSVLEIGTWEGMTGLLIWLHPKIKKFIAIDIHKGMKVDYNHGSHPQSSKSFIGHYLKDTKTRVDFIDTFKWDPEKWKEKAGQIDLVFIDGNHNYNHVANDTIKALKLKPKIIVWHDTNHEDDDNKMDQVPKYLREFERSKDIIYKNNIGYLICE